MTRRLASDPGPRTPVSIFTMLPPFAEQNLAINERALEAIARPVSLPAPDESIECSGSDPSSSSWTAWLRRMDGPRIALHSVRAPMREAEAWLERELGGRALPELIFVVGAGLGYVLDVLLARSSTARIVVLEPEPALMRGCLARRDWSDVIDARRLTLLAGPAYEGCETAWRAVSDPEAEPLILVHPVLGREREAAVAAALRLVTRILSDGRANETARRLFAVPYLLNTLENLPLLPREGDVRGVFGSCEHAPIIVVGAGPSLDDAMETLRGLRDRAILVAVDTALRPLLTEGIEPDFVVAVDPGLANVAHLTNLPACSRTALVAELSLPHAVFEGFRDRTLLFRVSNNHPWPWLATQGVDLGVLDAWGSVLVTAVDLAVKLGSGPIVLVGADLAYTAGQPYCRGTAYEDTWAGLIGDESDLAAVWARLRWDATCSEPAMEGGTTITAPRLIAFRDGLRDRIAKRPERRFINTGGRGILAGAHIEHMTLEEALGGRPPVAFDIAARQRSARARDVRVDPHVVSRGLLDVLRLVPPDWESGPGVAPTEEFVGRLIARLHGRPRYPRRDSWNREAAGWSAWLDLAQKTTTHASRWRALVQHRGLPLPRWPAERVQTLRTSASAATSSTWAGGESHPDGDEIRIFDALAASAGRLAALLGRERIVHRVIAPDALRRHVAEARIPPSTIFEWTREARADAQGLHDALATLAAVRDPEPDLTPDSRRTAPFTRSDGTPKAAAGFSEESPAVDVDAFARHVLLVEWVALIASHAADALDRQVCASLSSWLSERPAPRTSHSSGTRELSLRIGITNGSAAPLVSDIPLGLPVSDAARLLMGRWSPEAAKRSSDEDDDGIELVVVDRKTNEGLARERVSVALHGADRIGVHPRGRWFRRRGGWFPWTMPTGHGLPRAVFARTFDDASAILTPVGGSDHSVRLSADGSWSALPPWPVRIYGEAPLPGGGSLAWGYDNGHVIGLSTSQGTHHFELVPFWPWNVVIPPDRTPLWPTHADGLWEWMPGQGGRRVADLPSCLGAHLAGEEVQFDPSFRQNDLPRYAVWTEGEAYVYRPGEPVVRARPLPVEGPRFSVAVANAWTAEAYVHADLVKLSHRDGAIVWLICVTPVSVAWAGPSLVVTTSAGEVIFFRDLQPRLDAHAAHES